ncbi:MAG: L-serine ammonia-lyase, iron-sulfur-dependent, subunit alpha, partial [Chloroflexi bacterium]|nr:L-serine ammonia-lyase, iron-sulfur-dependent, subunit alpha [Chloroflexota bacterium]
MESILHLYRIGRGPSSSHTMGPNMAAQIFKTQHPQTHNFRVTLYGSLAATGKGHLTDRALRDVFSSHSLEIVWKPDELLPLHPNGMLFEALKPNGEVNAFWEVYSVGGGALKDQGQVLESSSQIYDLSSLGDIVAHCERQGQALWEYILEREGEDFWESLQTVWTVMQTSIDAGLKAEGVLPGELGVPRKAWAFYRRTQMLELNSRRSGLLSAYALAVSEENASGGVIVTAPTCGACGVLPAVLRYAWEMTNCEEDAVLRALATAGLIGNLVKYNGSISGAQVGCQGEIGTACAMAAGAAT